MMMSRMLANTWTSWEERREYQRTVGRKLMTRIRKAGKHSLRWSDIAYNIFRLTNKLQPERFRRRLSSSREGRRSESESWRGHGHAVVCQWLFMFIWQLLRDCGHTRNFASVRPQPSFMHLPRHDGCFARQFFWWRYKIYGGRLCLRYSGITKLERDMGYYSTPQH